MKTKHRFLLGNMIWMAMAYARMSERGDWIWAISWMIMFWVAFFLFVWWE